jgi:hypothetical protein
MFQKSTLNNNIDWRYTVFSSEVLAALDVENMFNEVNWNPSYTIIVINQDIKSKFIDGTGAASDNIFVPIY